MRYDSPTDRSMNARGSARTAMSTAYQHILFDVSAGVATLTLNRPERLNSFNAAMHLELRDALARAAADESVRALVLTGAGRGFCAGQDLNDRATAPGGAPPDLGASIERHYTPLVMSLRSLPKPVIAAVNGVAAGAGANIALACDVVVAARSASFIQAFCKLGLVPDAGGTYFLTRALGAPRALGLALFGDKLAAEQAQAWGLIWKCVDDAALMPTVRQMAEQLATGPALGYARTKQAIQAAETQLLQAQLDLERDLQRELGQSRDYREGVNAFLEKRAPRFGGT
jgi:2-(1,2-epoxy-1,2-dihydrophenyl)acetyl-CoA isomerase